jgi:hypothetical protein
MPVTRKLGPSPQGREADPAHIRAPITFPADSLSLPDAYARSLFEMSSELPPHIRDYAASNHSDVREGTRGFVYNSDMVSLVQFLDIGTRALALR